MHDYPDDNEGWRDFVRRMESRHAAELRTSNLTALVVLGLIVIGMALLHATKG